jgi:mRNA interferase RelE/StbE
MKWIVEISPAAIKQLKRLPKQEVQKMRSQLNQLALKENPISYLTPLKGDWAPFYKLRVGDYRLIIDAENETLTLLLVRAGHRKNVYDD